MKNFGMMKTLITSDPSELLDLLEDHSVDIMALDELTPETILISYTERNEWVEEHEVSNIVISLFTTAVARLWLWRHMQKVVNTPGCKLLYTDVSYDGKLKHFWRKIKIFVEN